MRKDHPKEILNLGRVTKFAGRILKIYQNLSDSEQDEVDRQTRQLAINIMTEMSKSNIAYEKLLSFLRLTSPEGVEETPTTQMSALRAATLAQVQGNHMNSGVAGPGGSSDSTNSSNSSSSAAGADSAVLF